MRISEVAQRAGIAPSAVRFYERSGAVPRAMRGENGCRAYGEDDLALRRRGLGPPEAGRGAAALVDRLEGDTELAALLARQREAIARRSAELDLLDAEIADLEEVIAAAGRDHGEADMSDRPIRVLFVCTGNSARSQIAEALLGHLAGSDFEPVSGGTDPKGVHPDTVTVLQEVGIDWSAARSKSVTEFLDEPFDYVITVCDRARQACPVFPGEHNSLHWGLEDPADVQGSADERLAAFRRTRTEIVNRLRPFIELARRGRRAATSGDAPLAPAAGQKAQEGTATAR